MKSVDLNLARRPFSNQRPVVRVAVLCWVIGGLLALGNVYLYWGYFSGFGNKSAELTEARDRVASGEQKIDRTENQLRSSDLEWQNKQVEFLNAQIAQRSFSWSYLFDRLSETLPRDARLLRLAPHFPVGGARDEEASARRATDQIQLALEGEAKNGKAMLDFIDALFRNEAFDAPNPSHESKQRSGDLRFSMTVKYRPGESRAQPATSDSAATRPVAAGSEGPASGGSAEGTKSSSGSGR
ncbi:MAG TPA: hypothetical protein VKA53_09500 [Thermoanaerobaculia bacterium]|nr:hypothetical protein [Thermoanaerobaculia bacterium]